MSFPNEDAKQHAGSLLERGYDVPFIAARCSCTEADVIALREEMAARPVKVDTKEPDTAEVDAFTEALTDFGTSHNKTGEHAMNLMRFLDMRLDEEQLVEYLDDLGFDGTRDGRKRLAARMMADFAILPRRVQKMTLEEIEKSNGA
jgi:citrate synthase